VPYANIGPIVVAGDAVAIAAAVLAQVRAMWADDPRPFLAPNEVRFMRTLNPDFENGTEPWAFGLLVSLAEHFHCQYIDPRDRETYDPPGEPIADIVGDEHRNPSEIYTMSIIQPRDRRKRISLRGDDDDGVFTVGTTHRVDEDHLQYHIEGGGDFHARAHFPDRVIQTVILEVYAITSDDVEEEYQDHHSDAKARVRAITKTITDYGTAKLLTSSLTGANSAIDCKVAMRRIQQKAKEENLIDHVDDAQYEVVTAMTTSLNAAIDLREDLYLETAPYMKARSGYKDKFNMYLRLLTGHFVGGEARATVLERAELASVDLSSEILLQRKIDAYYAERHDKFQHKVMAIGALSLLTYASYRLLKWWARSKATACMARLLPAPTCSVTALPPPIVQALDRPTSHRRALRLSGQAIEAATRSDVPATGWSEEAWTMSSVAARKSRFLFDFVAYPVFCAPIIEELAKRIPYIGKWGVTTYIVMAEHAATQYQTAAFNRQIMEASAVEPPEVVAAIATDCEAYKAQASFDRNLCGVLHCLFARMNTGEAIAMHAVHNVVATASSLTELFGFEHGISCVEDRIFRGLLAIYCSYRVCSRRAPSLRDIRRKVGGRALRANRGNVMGDGAVKRLLPVFACPFGTHSETTIGDVCFLEHKADPALPLVDSFSVSEPSDTRCVQQFGCTSKAGFSVVGARPSIYRSCACNEGVSIRGRVGKLLPVHEPGAYDASLKAWDVLIEAVLPSFVLPEYTKKSMLKWSASFVPERRDLLRKLWREREPITKRELEASSFIKREKALKLTERAGADLSDPRFIQGCHPMVSLECGRDMQALAKTLAEAMKPTGLARERFYYACGMTTRDVGDTFREMIDRVAGEMDPGDTIVFLEDDQSRFDAHMLAGPFAFLAAAYKQFRVPRRVRRLLRRGRQKGRTRRGSKYVHVDQMQSGKPDTSVGDTIVNMAMKLAIHKGVWYSLVNGDDSVTVTTKHSLELMGGVEAIKRFYALFGMEAKVFLHFDALDVEFCSGRFFPVLDSYVLMPKTSNLLGRMGWDMKDRKPKAAAEWALGIGLTLRCFGHVDPLCEALASAIINHSTLAKIEAPRWEHRNPYKIHPTHGPSPTRLQVATYYDHHYGINHATLTDLGDLLASWQPGTAFEHPALTKMLLIDTG